MNSLNLCLNHKEKTKYSHFDEHNCAYCKLEKELAECTKLIRAQGAYCKQKHLQVESLWARLDESVPKSKLIALLQNETETGFPDSRKVIIQNLKKLLTTGE